MNLVIKPTEACNFSCTFCSSSYLVDDKKARLELDKIFQFLKRFPDTEKIFVVGGDPLMMPPTYYFDLIKHIENNKYKAILSLTTNLWDFYKKPDKWIELFNHPKIEIGTSFQYGSGRQIKPGEVFTEQHFREIYRMFQRYVPGKDLSFLAVIDESNEHLAIDHLYLAKDLKTQCRLVYAAMSGKAGDVYPIAKMISIYIQIWKLGLSDYEESCFTVSEKLKNVFVGCNLDRQCDSTMRSLNADGRYFSCGPLNDDLDKENEIDFGKEMAGDFFKPIQASKYRYLKEECFGCKMFEICNGCVKHIKDLKRTNKVEENCIKMKSLEKDFLEMANSTLVQKNFRGEVNNG